MPEVLYFSSADDWQAFVHDNLPGSPPTGCRWAVDVETLRWTIAERHQDFRQRMRINPAGWVPWADSSKANGTAHESRGLNSKQWEALVLQEVCRKAKRRFQLRSGTIYDGTGDPVNAIMTVRAVSGWGVFSSTPSGLCAECTARCCTPSGALPTVHGDPTPRAHVRMTAHQHLSRSVPVPRVRKGENAPYAVYLDVSVLAFDSLEAPRIYVAANGAVCTPDVVPRGAMMVVV